MSDRTHQAQHGCGKLSRLHWTIFGILSISILPLAFWCSYKHIKHFYSTDSNAKLLFKLSIAVYLFTILGSLFTTITSFSACHISDTIWTSLWSLQGLCWILQWFFFVCLLFSRYVYDSLHILLTLHHTYTYCIKTE